LESPSAWCRLAGSCLVRVAKLSSILGGARRATNAILTRPPGSPTVKGVRARQEVESTVAECCAYAAGRRVEDVSSDTALSDLGLDSLGLAEVSVALEERLGARLADWNVESMGTVGQLAGTVRAEMRAGRPRIPPGTGKYQRLGKALAGWYIRLYCRMKVRGTENVPTTGPVIIAANHRSMWDVPIHVVACPRPVTFMAKKELFKGPLLAWAWRVLGGFPVRREISDIRAIDTGLAVLERGEVLGLYPEGTRSLSGEMLPFLKGAAWIALRSGAPIVPSGLKGTGRRPAEGKPLIGKRVEVIFGPPIATRREDDPEARKKKAEELTSELLAAITRLSS
jgi:1-acyl-sn-glycerol-3-phosphate acyltransferase